MKDVVRRARNLYSVLSASVRSRVFRKNTDLLNWLVHKQIKIGKQVISFSYRYNSEGDCGVIEQVFYNQDYRIEKWPQGRALMHLYESQSKRNKLLIIDAGSNIGAASIYFSVVYPASKIIAIEPERNNCALARLNCVDRDIELLEGAIGASPGTLYLQDPGLSDWGFRVGSEGEYQVKVTTVVDIVSDNSSLVPLICKVDIEGSEADLFGGNCDWIRKFQLIILETHDWMLPGKGNSRSFYQQISGQDFDILQNGENTFCFNNRLLKDWY
jgi:FkbM family methyltransferase